MKNFNFALLYFAILFVASGSTNVLNAQSTCPTAVPLALDMNCGGDPFGGGANSGDPTGNDDTDGNVCSTNYSNGDDYIFTYTATSDDALQLDLYAENTWTGIMVTEGCPTTGTCFASATSSSTDESLTTPPMTPGTTYYIHISTFPSPQSSGQFCLDAALVDLTVEVSCGMPLNQTLCYDNNSSEIYVYESDNGSPLTITFNAGGIESCCDDVLIYDGNSPFGIELYADNNGGDMTGVTVTANSGVMYVTVDSDGSVSCASGSGCCPDPLDWTVTCDAVTGPTCDDGIQNGDEEGIDCGGSNCDPCVAAPTCDDGIQNGDEEGVDCGGSNCAPCPVVCVEPVASATVTSYCGPGVFMVMVNLGDLGSANAVSISNDGGQPTLQNVFFPRRYFVGPFSVGDVVNITIADQNDPSCSIVLEGLAADCNMGLAGAGNLSGVSAQTDISVFPNPTSGAVNVNLGSIFGQKANIRIMNAVGQLIEERQIDAVENVTERFDLSNQQAGMYFIHVDVAGGESHVERVILGTARP